MKIKIGMKLAHRRNTRAHWAAYYIDRFNKTGNHQAEHMALWLLLLIELEKEVP